MKELVIYIVKALVDNPGEVEVREVESDKGIIVEIKVAAGDIGKVIGREGRIIKAIRTVVSCASAKMAKKVSVEITE
ncbi:MAG: KH domain-containing protein [Endomicrobiales bacterium]|nr:KH domain-containing protein [Endomicrobiales bacterium]